MQVVWNPSRARLKPFTRLYRVIGTSRKQRFAPCSVGSNRRDTFGMRAKDAPTCIAQPNRPAASRLARSAIIDRFCQGSVEELVSGMVDAKVPQQLNWLASKSCPAPHKKGR